MEDGVDLQIQVGVPVARDGHLGEVADQDFRLDHVGGSWPDDAGRRVSGPSGSSHASVPASLPRVP